MSEEVVDGNGSWVNQYEVEDGYETDEGVYWDTAPDLIHGHLFGFCCCGRPHDFLRKIAGALWLVRELTRKDYESWQEHYDGWKERRDEILGDSGNQYTYWYLLDRAGLTEHGSSVPGWLTPKGERVLNDLKRILEKSSDD